MKATRTSPPLHGWLMVSGLGVTGIGVVGRAGLRVLSAGGADARQSWAGRWPTLNAKRIASPGRRIRYSPPRSRWGGCCQSHGARGVMTTGTVPTTVVMRDSCGRPDRLACPHFFRRICDRRPRDGDNALQGRVFAVTAARGSIDTGRERVLLLTVFGGLASEVVASLTAALVGWHSWRDTYLPTSPRPPPTPKRNPTFL